MRIFLCRRYFHCRLFVDFEYGDSGQSELRLAALSEIPVLEVDKEVERVSQILLTEQAIPEKYPEDAIHIAVAAVSGMDFIVTWNFKHINNPFMKQRMRLVLMSSGYPLPETVSPDELLEVGDE